ACQMVHAHAGWKGERLGDVSAAWYQRTVSVPKEWAGRRIALSVDYLNSYAAVFVNGSNCGEIRFPGGELDVTAHLRPGSSNLLNLLVVAMPLKGVMLSYTDSNAAREVKGRVERRGLCGDVYLTSTPFACVTDVKVDTSFRKGEIRFNAALERLTADRRYELRIQDRANGGG